ncbi:MAG: efflux transporter outer membrane subunit [Verrucomicrobia bacterium]|jgi:NodT family efflux transporter outer membrane factor (OMF) lipoprotein|nr:efflux transporter outer membrane subunit [Verrucomicrobiota bacterium]
MKPVLCTFLIAFTGLVFAACSGVETAGGVADRQADAMVANRPDMPESFRAVDDARPVELHWLGRFKSPQLNALVAEAQAHNRDLQAAAAQVERARALAAKAGAALKPSLAVAGTGGTTGLIENRQTLEDFSLGAQVSWEVDIWGKLSAGQRGAAASAEAAEAQLVFARHAIAAATAQAYFAALEGSLQLRLASENIQTLEALARIVQIQYDNGLANSQDLALSKSDLALARSQLEEVSLARRDALRALELLLGRYPGAELELVESLPSLPASPPPGLPSELLERRPDVVAAERQVASAFEATARARAARLPTLSLTGNLGNRSTELADILRPDNLAWQAAGNLLAPLIDGGARRADLAAATASQQEAVANYAQTALQAFGEVESFLDLGGSLRTRAGQLDEAAVEAARALKIAELRHKEGEAPLLDVLTVQQRVAARKSQSIHVQRLQLDQRVKLYLALGGDW